jgi:hypothetical protein
MEAAQTEKQKAFRIASLVVLGLAIMTLLLPAYALIFIVPVFAEMFTDTQMALPALTSLLLSAPPTAYIFLFALLILGLIVKEAMIRNKIVTLVVNAVIIVGVCPFLFFFIWTMYLPIYRAGG